jgi:NDP-sugar pyrophosphorylase family protein
LEYIRSEEDGILKNCDWSYVVESEPLGTGGAIANAIWEQEILGDFLVTNSDTWFDGDLLPLINENYQSVGLIFEEKVGRYGLVNINSSNVITAFDEKSPIQVGGLVNLGFYNLNASSFNRIKKKKFSLEYELFPELINEGLLKGIQLKGRFIDIGIPESYFHMNQFARDNNL